jgi:sigma-B regulation protein RsbU (phosphoserine phosphatase)
VHLLQSQRNIALGMVETEFTSDTSALCEGDVLFLYTDGLTEAEDASRRILGTDGLQAELAKLVTSLPDANIEVMRRRLTQAMATHRGTLMAHDDTTFLIARLGEEPARGDQLETIANELG